MRHPISKGLLLLALLQFAIAKKDDSKSGPSVKADEVRKKYKFKPPSKTDYEAIVKAAKEDKSVVEQDEVDLTYIKGVDNSVRAGTSRKELRWPYEMWIQIDPAYGKEETKTIMASIETLNKAMTCFSFYVIPIKQKIDKKQDYLFIKLAGSGCHSKLGRRGGRQETVVSKSCFKKLYGTTIHEIMHVLGFYHEHVRPDRDKWVTINFDNLPPGDESKKLQYDIRDEQQAFESEYDYESIMHYNLNDILVVNPKTKKKPGSGFKVGQRDHLSPKDIQRLNKMYPCGKDKKPLKS